MDASRVKDDLDRVGYSLISDAFTEDDCQLVLGELEKVRSGQIETSKLGLNDSDDVCNVIYQSKRSLLSYCYLKTPAVMAFSREITDLLDELTDMNWKSNINLHCLPLFEYTEGGFIEPHRGRDVGFGRNDFVAIGMLTQSGEDFNGGLFYLNKEGTASPDGKTILSENKSSRKYFNLQPGEIFLFDNTSHIHGTEEVSMGNNRAYRATVSWRIE